MQEWSDIFKIGAGITVMCLFLSLVFLVVAITMDSANEEMEHQLNSVSGLDLDGYDGKVVDAAMGKNIARANKERVGVVLSTAGEADALVSGIPQEAHVQINDFFISTDPGPPTTTHRYTITVERDETDELFMRFTRN